MKTRNMTRCAGLLAAVMLASLPSMTQARDPGINQPGAYGGRPRVSASGRALAQAARALEGENESRGLLCHCAPARCPGE